MGSNVEEGGKGGRGAVKVGETGGVAQSRRVKSQAH